MRINKCNFFYEESLKSKGKERKEKKKEKKKNGTKENKIWKKDQKRDKKKDLCVRVKDRLSIQKQS